MRADAKADCDFADDVALVEAFADRQPSAVRIITERNNQRLFRAAWAILKNRAEAEDAVQSAYLRAFGAAATYQGRSSLTTWLTRIVINEALGRRRSAQRRLAKLDGTSVTILEEYREKMMRGSMPTMQDSSLACQQIRQLLEAAIAKLPENFRVVFVLREIEGLSVQEVAETLEIDPGTVKTRDHRARRLLREALAPEMSTALAGTFPFAGADCAAMTERVIAEICGS
jgi:RNA polymerase sigma-70 factor (ECF subfamily)